MSQDVPVVNFGEGEPGKLPYTRIFLFAFLGVIAAIIFFSMLAQPKLYAKLMGAKIADYTASSDSLVRVAATSPLSGVVTPTKPPTPACMGVQHCTYGNRTLLEYCGNCTGAGCRPGYACADSRFTCTTYPDKVFYFDTLYPVPCGPTRTPTITPTKPPTSTPSRTPTKSPTPSTLRTYSLVPQKPYVTNGTGKVTLYKPAAPTGYTIYRVVSTSFTGLVPGRQYDVWVCGSGSCSGQSNTRVTASASGTASWTGSADITVRNVYPATTVQIRENLLPGPVPTNPPSCGNTACMSATL